MKKICAVVLIVGIFLSNMVGTSNALSSSEYVTLPKYTLNVNGVTVDMEGDNIPLFQYNGDYMVPLRKVAELLGYTVYWDQDTHEVLVGDSIQSISVNNNSSSYSSMKLY